MRWLLVILAISISFAAQAQKMAGRIIASKTYTPVANALVANKRTGETTYSDSSGRYSLGVVDGDLLFFYCLGYRATRETVRLNNGEITTVVMTVTDIELDEVQIQGRTYQMDSIERSIVYRKTLNDANEKVKMRVGLGAATGGIGFEGLIGKLASKITGREKRVQGFKKMFVQGEKDKFIATRYTIALVTKVTGLTGEDAALFMNSYSMPYDFARAASELELQMWVLNNFRQYKNKSKQQD